MVIKYHGSYWLSFVLRESEPLVLCFLLSYNIIFMFGATIENSFGNMRVFAKDAKSKEESKKKIELVASPFIRGCGV